METISCEGCKYYLVRLNAQGYVRYMTCTNKHEMTPKYISDKKFSCVEWEQKVKK